MKIENNTSLKNREFPNTTNNCNSRNQAKPAILMTLKSQTLPPKIRNSLKSKHTVVDFISL